MKKKIIVTLLEVGLVATIFTGCAECIGTEQENVEVKAVDEYYKQQS